MFNTFLKSEIDRLDLPGLAVAITQGGQELFATGYGHCDAAQKNPITPDTLFGVASVTKLVTAIETMRLQDQQRLSVHDPVKLFYPDLHVAAVSRMQLRHLLSHSSGLPGLPSRFFSVNLQRESDSSGGIGINRSQNKKLPQKTTLLRSIDLPEFLNKLKIAPLAPPGKLLNYSNEGYCLLGGVIEQVTGEPYQQQVSNSILTPLKMANSLVGFNSTFDGNIAIPLIRDGSGLREAGVWDAPLFYPAGGLLSSARDLARLLSVLSNASEFLSPESRHALAQPAMKVMSRPESSIGYGYGLEYLRLDSDNTLHWHTGQRTGVSSFVAWVSGDDVAVSVLSHIADAPVAGIGFELIGLLLDRSDVIWPLLSDRVNTNHNTVCSSAINHFQGIYRSEEGFEYQVELTDSTLYLTSRNHSTVEPFSFTDDQSGIVGQQNFRFLNPQETGFKSCALALDLRILVRAEKH